MLIGAMILPGTPSLVFLFYVLLLLPWMAFRSSRRLKQQPELLADGRVSRRVWKSTVLMLLLLLWMAAATGRGFGYDVFEVPEEGVCDGFGADMCGPSLCWSEVSKSGTE
ncbi:MAG: hypothetical protein ACK5YO_21830, partial [Planctomyces sp.]